VDYDLGQVIMDCWRPRIFRGFREDWHYGRLLEPLMSCHITSGIHCCYEVII